MAVVIREEATCDVCRREVESKHQLGKIDVPDAWLPNIPSGYARIEIRATDICSTDCGIKFLTRVRMQDGGTY